MAGKDTFLLSDYATNLEVDLRAAGIGLRARSARRFRRRAEQRFARGNIFNALLFDGDPRSLIESVVGGSGDDRVRGNSAENRLSGGRGDDWLAGENGEDRLTGGPGGDVLLGGAGDDTFLLHQGRAFPRRRRRPPFARWTRRPSRGRARWAATCCIFHASTRTWRSAAIRHSSRCLPQGGRPANRRPWRVDGAARLHGRAPGADFKLLIRDDEISAASDGPGDSPRFRLGRRVSCLKRISLFRRGHAGG